jgi:hypothetical protein
MHDPITPVDDHANARICDRFASLDFAVSRINSPDREIVQ